MILRVPPCGSLSLNSLPAGEDYDVTNITVKGPATSVSRELRGALGTLVAWEV